MTNSEDWNLARWIDFAARGRRVCHQTPQRQPADCGGWTETGPGLHSPLGLERPGERGWKRPPEASWPPGTTAGAGQAVRTPFSRTETGDREVTISFDLPLPAKKLAFVLHLPQENRWLNNAGKDFVVRLGKPGASANGTAELLPSSDSGEPVRQCFPWTAARSLLSLLPPCRGHSRPDALQCRPAPRAALGNRLAIPARMAVAAGTVPPCRHHSLRRQGGTHSVR